MNHLAREGKPSRRHQNQDHGNHQQDDKRDVRHREQALDLLQQAEEFLVFGKILRGKTTGEVVVTRKPERDSPAGHFEHRREYAFQKQEHHAHKGKQRGYKARRPYRSQTSVFVFITHRQLLM